jgi:hypothetical protein
VRPAGDVVSSRWGRRTKAALAILLTTVAGGAAGAEPAGAAYPEGAFVNNVDDGRVYRIAGGAPIYVSTWDAVGGPQPSAALNTAQLRQLRQYPADGTVISTSRDGRVYIAAGGALLYVSVWSAIGGARPAIEVDRWARENTSNPHAHLRPYPADGTFLRASDGAVYRVVGGYPFHVPTWTVYGGVQDHAGVDSWAISARGNHFSGLRAAPVDGTIVRGLPSGQVWRIEGGLRSPSTGPSASGFVDVPDVSVLALPPLPSPAAPPPSIAPAVVEAFTVAGAFRDGRLFQLRLRGVVRGSRVTVRCVTRCGKRGRIAASRQRGRGGRQLHVALRRALRPRSRFVVRVSRKGRSARARSFRVRAGDIVPLGTRCYEARVRTSC